MIGARQQRHRFTPEDEARMLRLSQAGWSGRRIAAEISCSKSAVSDRLALLRKREQIAAPAPRRAWKKFTCEDDRRLLTLYADGLSVTQIGAEIGRTHQSIYARLHLLRIRGGAVTRETPEKKRRPVPGYAGVVRCLGGCEQNFLSWDRRKNRICPTCRNRQSQTHGVAEHSLYL